ncbi:Gp37 family protein [Paraburkholderia fungorum]
MSVIASIEALVVARLTAALTITGQAHPCVDVEPWPDDPVAYKMIHPLGAVLVMYHGAKFDETATARQLIGFDARFEIGLLSKTLRAPVVGVDASEPDTGVYTLLDACRAAFVGWQPDGAANTARLVAESYEGYREGVWSYSLSIAIPMLTVVDREPPPGLYDVPDEPPLQGVTGHYLEP